MEKLPYTGQEVIILHTPGSIPGIPGESHGPGTFLVDWDTRTIEELVPPVSEVPPEEQPPAPVQPPEEQSS